MWSSRILIYMASGGTAWDTLVPHVDREETHAASVIVNIGQYSMDEARPPNLTCTGE